MQWALISTCLLSHTYPRICDVLTACARCALQSGIAGVAPCGCHQAMGDATLTQACTSLPLESWGVGRSVYCGCDESTLADAPVSQGETAGSQQALIDNLGSYHAPGAFQLSPAGMHPKPLRGLVRCWMQQHHNQQVGTIAGKLEPELPLWCLNELLRGLQVLPCFQPNCEHLPSRCS